MRITGEYREVYKTAKSFWHLLGPDGFSNEFHNEIPDKLSTEALDPEEKVWPYSKVPRTYFGKMALTTLAI